MATFSGARQADAHTTSAQSSESGITDAILDAIVVALIAAGFVTLAFNTIARLSRRPGAQNGGETLAQGASPPLRVQVGGDERTSGAD